MAMRPSSRIGEELTEAVALGAEGVRDRDSARVEPQGMRVGRVPAHLPVRGLDGESRRSGRDDDGRDLARGVRARGHRHHGGDRRSRVRDERLRPVDRPTRRPRGAHASGSLPASLPASASVRPNAASARPAQRSGNQLLALFLGAVRGDRRGAEPHCRLERDGDRRIDSRQLLDGDAQRREVGAGSAVLRREREPEQTEVAHRPAPTSRGNTCSRSQRSACGAISCSAKSRTTLRKASCSSERSKFMEPIRPRRAPCRRRRLSSRSARPR